MLEWWLESRDVLRGKKRRENGILKLKGFRGLVWRELYGKVGEVWGWR